MRLNANSDWLEILNSGDLNSVKIYSQKSVFCRYSSKLVIFIFLKIWFVKYTQTIMTSSIYFWKIFWIIANMFSTIISCKEVIKDQKVPIFEGDASKKKCWHQHRGVMWPWNFAQTCLSKSYAHWKNFKIKCFVVQELLKKVSRVGRRVNEFS